MRVFVTTRIYVKITVHSFQDFAQEYIYVYKLYLFCHNRTENPENIHVSCDYFSKLIG